MNPILELSLKGETHMKVIRSKMIQYTKKLELNHLFEFFEKARATQSTIILCKEGLSSDCKNFSNLLSFFLCLKEGDSYLLIAEGNDAEQTIDRLSIT